MLDGLGEAGVELGARSSGTEADLATPEIGNVHKTQIPWDISGSLVESGSEGGTLGDLMELRWVIVIKEDKEAECVLDNGEGVFGCEGGHGPIVQDEDGDRLAGVDVVGELCLGQEVVVVGVFRETGENVGDIVGRNGGGEGSKSEKQEQRL